MDPYLVLSKLFWLVAEPSSFLLTLWLGGTALLWTPWRNWGRGLVTLAALTTLAVAMFPIGQLVIKPIEDRFHPLVALPPRSPSSPPAKRWGSIRVDTFATPLRG